MSDEDSKSRINRRNVLRGVATASAAAAIGSVSTQSAAAASDLSKDTNIDTLSGSEKNTTVASALSDPEVKKIRKSYLEEGWKVRRNQASAWRTTTDGQEYRSVSIPVDTGEKDGRKTDESAAQSTAYILWSSDEELSAVGHYYPDGSSLDSSNESDDVELVITRVENGAVTTERSEISSNEVTTQSITCVCTGSLDMECVAKIGLAAGVASDPCKACYVDPTKATCLACASAAILAGWELTDCCTDCWRCCDLTFPWGCSEYC